MHRRHAARTLGGLGECTAREVIKQADRQEHNGRFLRLIAAGVPPTGKISDYVTPEEAAERWEMAAERPSVMDDPNFAWAFNLMMKGVKGMHNLARAKNRVKELELHPYIPHTFSAIELDCLVRAISDYEARQ